MILVQAQRWVRSHRLTEVALVENQLAVFVRPGCMKNTIRRDDPIPSQGRPTIGCRQSQLAKVRSQRPGRPTRLIKRALAFNVSRSSRSTKDHIPSRRDTRPPLTSRQNTPSGPITTKSASAQRFLACRARPTECITTYRSSSPARSLAATFRSAALGKTPRARERTSPSAADRRSTRWTDRPPSPQGDPDRAPGSELTRRLRQQRTRVTGRKIHRIDALIRRLDADRVSTTPRRTMHYLDKRCLQTTRLSHPDHAAKAAAESDDARCRSRDQPVRGAVDPLTQC